VGRRSCGRLCRRRQGAPAHPGRSRGVEDVPRGARAGAAARRSRRCGRRRARRLRRSPPSRLRRPAAAHARANAAQVRLGPPNVTHPGTRCASEHTSECAVSVRPSAVRRERQSGVFGTVVRFSVRSAEAGQPPYDRLSEQPLRGCRRRWPQGRARESPQRPCPCLPLLAASLAPGGQPSIWCWTSPAPATRPESAPKQSGGRSKNLCRGDGVRDWGDALGVKPVDEQAHSPACSERVICKASLMP
jgi:hypothetical protein